MKSILHSVDVTDEVFLIAAKNSNHMKLLINMEIADPDYFAVTLGRICRDISRLGGIPLGDFLDRLAEVAIDSSDNPRVYSANVDPPERN